MLEPEPAPTERVVVDPARVRQFGEAVGTHFRLVTDATHADAFVISTGAQYESCAVMAVEDGMEFEEVISSRVPEPAHVLVISPSRFFESPPDELIGPRRKLLAMACNSTPTDLDVIRHFLRVIERTDPAEQDAFAERFFDTIEQAEHLEVVHMGTRSTLRFDHLREDYVWNQQAGSVDWGEQQIVPSGEISVLPIEIRSFDSALCLALNGELTLNGHPILHSGTPSHLRTDQARLHQELLAMRDHPIVATIEGGRISALRATGPGCAPAVEALEAMFHVDSRYRIVWEIGHAVNTALDLLPGNHAMNEVYGGDRGCLHWGLGLTPYTQYHLDIISPGTRVLTDRGVPVLG
jgi:hypothetical protein